MSVHVLREQVAYHEIIGVLTRSLGIGQRHCQSVCGEIVLARLHPSCAVHIHHQRYIIDFHPLLRDVPCLALDVQPHLGLNLRRCVQVLHPLERLGHLGDAHLHGQAVLDAGRGFRRSGQIISDRIDSPRKSGQCTRQHIAVRLAALEPGRALRIRPAQRHVLDARVHRGVGASEHGRGACERHIRRIGVKDAGDFQFAVQSGSAIVHRAFPVHCGQS